MQTLKFIKVETAFGEKTVAIDQIAFIEPLHGGTKITLKVISNNQNIALLCAEKYSKMLELIDRISKKQSLDYC